MLHIEASPSDEWQDFAGVRDTLDRWKLIPKGSPRRAVGQLGIDVDKHPGDLIVLAVHQHHGRMRWLEKSVGQPSRAGPDK